MWGFSQHNQILVSLLSTFSLFRILNTPPSTWKLHCTHLHLTTFTVPLQELDYILFTSPCSLVTCSVFKDKHDSFFIYTAFVFPWPGIIKMVNPLLQRHQLLIILHYLPILLRTSCPDICALNYIIYLSSYHLQTHTLVLYPQPFIYIQHATLHYWLPMSSKNRVFVVVTHGYQQLCVCVSHLI